MNEKRNEDKIFTKYYDTRTTRTIKQRRVTKEGEPKASVFKRGIHEVRISKHARVHGQLHLRIAAADIMLRGVIVILVAREPPIVWTRGHKTHSKYVIFPRIFH